MIMVYSYNQWQAYVNQTIDLIVMRTTLGVAFNCLNSHFDRYKTNPRLFYLSPATW